MTKLTPPYLAFDPATRHLRLDPHEPAFFQDPYEAYAFLHGSSNAFFWEEFGFLCFGGFDDVNRLLRDRRFGRQNPAGIPDRRQTVCWRPTPQWIEPADTAAERRFR